MISPSGFWTFFCNPQKWALDDFLLSNQEESSFSITDWQKDWFKPGQLGVIRVGHDYRTKEQLGGKPKLERGIYAVVEVTGEPFYSSKKDDYYYNGSDQESIRVPIKYLRNLLNRPILIDELNLEEHEYDKYLIEGFQASSMPLNPQTLRKIYNIVDHKKTKKPIPLMVGREYSRKDIFHIFDVSVDKQKGNWYTGYNSYNNDYFIFANINSAGRTGHEYDNKFVGDDLQWFSKKTHSLSSPTIQAMLNMNTNVYIFTREDNNNPNFVYQGNGKAKDYEDTSPVKVIWEFIDEREMYPNKPPEEIINPKKFKEGATKEITVNIFERNPVARKKCVEFYGYNCVVCNFNFEEVYGDLGESFIHVHHIKELSSIAEEYEVDPITDLRPVCPNCHAMIHKRKPALSIAELKNILENRPINKLISDN